MCMITTGNVVTVFWLSLTDPTDHRILWSETDPDRRPSKLFLLLDVRLNMLDLACSNFMWGLLCKFRYLTFIKIKDKKKGQWPNALNNLERVFPVEHLQEIFCSFYFAKNNNFFYLINSIINIGRLCPQVSVFYSSHYLRWDRRRMREPRGNESLPRTRTLAWPARWPLVVGLRDRLHCLRGYSTT